MELDAAERSSPPGLPGSPGRTTRSGELLGPRALGAQYISSPGCVEMLPCDGSHDNYRSWAKKSRSY